MKKLHSFIISILFALHAPSAFSFQATPFIELLVMQASQETASTWATVVATDEFSEKNNDFGWDAGFRGGFTFETESFADIKLYWTHFSTDSDAKIPIAGHLVIPEFFSGFLSGDIFFGAKQNWDIEMNMVDLEMSHQFNIAKNISLRPMIGIKGGTINQNIDTQWQAVLYNATEKVESNYWGIGPNFGISGMWNITETLNFMSSLAAAFMWGEWDVKDVYKRPSVPGLVDPTTITTKMSGSELGTLALNYFVGLNWSPKALPRVNVGIGYELQYWANQVRLPTFEQLPTHGDLTLQGATCRFSLDLY